MLKATWRATIFRGNRGRYVSETADYDLGQAAWRDEMGHVSELLYLAENVDRVSQLVDGSDLELQLKTNERLLLVLRGSGIVELKGRRTGDGGGDRDIGYRITERVSYRVSAHGSSGVSGPEAQTVVDPGGTVVITTHRLFYTSPTWNRVWEFSKTVDMFHSDTVGEGWAGSYLEVTNRKRVSGFIYRSGFARSVRDRLVLALAVADGTLEDMVLALKAEQEELQRA